MNCAREMFIIQMNHWYPVTPAFIKFLNGVVRLLFIISGENSMNKNLEWATELRTGSAVEVLQSGHLNFPGWVE